MESLCRGGGCPLRLCVINRPLGCPSLWSHACFLPGLQVERSSKRQASPGRKRDPGSIHQTALLQDILHLWIMEAGLRSSLAGWPKRDHPQSHDAVTRDLLQISQGSGGAGGDCGGFVDACSRPPPNSVFGKDQPISKVHRVASSYLHTNRDPLPRVTSLTP